MEKAGEKLPQAAVIVLSRPGLPGYKYIDSRHLDVFPLSLLIKIQFFAYS